MRSAPVGRRRAGQLARDRVPGAEDRLNLLHGARGVNPTGELSLSKVPHANKTLQEFGDPFLHLVHVGLEPAGGGPAVDERTVRPGFRELRIRDGWFDGRRIFLHRPTQVTTPRSTRSYRRMLAWCVRTSCTPRPPG